MLTILTIVAILIVIAIGGIVVYAALQPNTFSVQRSITMNAPPDDIFPYLTDFRRSQDWSPYEKKDPDMKRTFSGAENGKGAVYEWDGDGTVGAGRMEIVDVTPPAKAVIKLDMIRPMETSNIVEYTLTPSNGATGVTWSMRGPVPFFARLMCVFSDMEAMIGTDLEAGLTNLKSVVEARK